LAYYSTIASGVEGRLGFPWSWIKVPRSEAISPRRLNYRPLLLSEGLVKVRGRRVPRFSANRSFLWSIRFTRRFLFLHQHHVHHFAPPYKKHTCTLLSASQPSNFSDLWRFIGFFSAANPGNAVVSATSVLGKCNETNESEKRTSTS
jgi:hypothetical protein